LIVSSRLRISSSIVGACVEDPATAGLPAAPPFSAMSGSPGCQTRTSSTIAAVEASAATMSVSSTEM
jgi:hypothetical protein